MDKRCLDMKKFNLIILILLLVTLFPVNVSADGKFSIEVDSYLDELEFTYEDLNYTDSEISLIKAIQGKESYYSLPEFGNKYFYDEETNSGTEYLNMLLLNKFFGFNFKMREFSSPEVMLSFSKGDFNPNLETPDVVELFGGLQDISTYSEGFWFADYPYIANNLIMIFEEDNRDNILKLGYTNPYHVESLDFDGMKLQLSENEAAEALRDGSIDAYLCDYNDYELLLQDTGKFKEFSFASADTYFNLFPMTLAAPIYKENDYETFYNQFFSIYRKALDFQIGEILDDYVDDVKKNNESNYFSSSLSEDENQFLNSIQKIYSAEMYYGPFNYGSSEGVTGDYVELFRDFVTVHKINLDFDNASPKKLDPNDVKREIDKGEESDGIYVQIGVNKNSLEADELDTFVELHEESYYFMTTFRKYDTPVSSNNLEDMTIGYLRDIPIEPGLIEYYNIDTLEPVTSIFEAYFMLETNQLDYVIIPSTSFKYYTRKYPMLLLDSAGTASSRYSNTSGILFPDTEVGRELQSIFQKYVNATGNIESIEYWSSYEFELHRFNMFKAIALGVIIAILILTAISNAISKMISVKRLNKRLYTDHLTGLLNRYSLMHRKIRKRHYHLVLINIDDFKSVNDICGHEVGDVVLKKVGKRLSDFFGKNNVYHIGADEFIVVTYCRRKDGEYQCHNQIKMVNRFLEKLAVPIFVGNNKVRLSASAGITQPANSKAEITKLLNDAEIALKLAKSEDNSHIKMLDEGTRAKEKENLVLENAFRNSFVTNEIIAYYQPIVDMKTERVVGFEALARWVHDGKVYPPGMFLPIAKRLGLLARLDHTVLSNALAYYKSLIYNKVVEEDFILSVNISDASLLQINVKEVIGQVKSYGVDPKNVKFEILEETVIYNELLEKVNELHDAGFQISIDDFSAGHSSLKQLSKFSMDTMKIDRLILPEDKNDNVDNKIYETIIDLANRLELNVISEGVETEEQLRYLQAIGVQYGQGYYFSKPVDNTSFTELIKESNE
jgi:diguanylate cyclase (GGDEF)-like protein